MMIRPVAVRDLDVLMALETEAFPSEPWSLSVYTEYAARGGRCLVVEHKQRPRAAIWYGPRKGTKDWEIASLATALKYRGHGFGGALVKRVVAEARRAGAAGLVLEVRPSNAAAQELYFRLGFQSVRVLPGYYLDGEDGIEMRLDLGSAP